MKRLEKLLLMNWHYIVYDVLNVEQVTFLTGKNGAGKSTILDALQMPILGDTSGHFFNKAANDNSRRTLKGYLYGEVAEGEESGVVYLRANETFSSYVIAEFADTVKKKRLCMGIVFDCNPDGSFNHRFFSLMDELPAFHFIRDGVPLGIQELRQWGAKLAKGKFELYETNKRYQDMFRSHMGNIGEKFFRLFRKAVPFSPIMDVAGFISEFVCDVNHRLDIDDMRENIRHYRRLEADLGYVQHKVTALTAIKEQSQGVAIIEERLQVNRYLLHRARIAELETMIQNLDAQLNSEQSRLEELANILVKDEERLRELQSKRDEWRDEQVRSDVYATKQNLENRKQLLEAEFVTVNQSLQRQERFLFELIARWSATGDGVKRALLWFQTNQDNPVVDGEIGTLATLEDALHHAYNAIEEAVRVIRKPYDVSGKGLLGLDLDKCKIDVNQLTHVRNLLVDGSDALHMVSRTLKTVLINWTEEQQDLEQVIAELKKGIKPYDSKVLLLQRAIVSAIKDAAGKDIPVPIFSEVLDIPDAMWHQAIEGYLHTQRFYLLVPPEYFQDALKVYDSVKREKHIFDVGLVDIGRIMEQNPERLPGSLAEEVQADDAFARAYTDFLLGRVMKCNDVHELRQHRTGITADGMLYQNFVARQMDAKRWENLFIGKRALAQQLEQKSARLTVVAEYIETWKQREQIAGQFARMTPPSDEDIRDVTEVQDAFGAVPRMQKELRHIIDELGSLDLSYLLELAGKIKRCEKQIEGVHAHRDVTLKEQTQVEANLRHLETEQRPQIGRDMDEASQKIRSLYNETFVLEQGEPKFVQELDRLKSPSVILTNFGRQMQADITRKESLWSELVKLRADYNRDFQAGFDIHLSDNVVYEVELNRLVDSQLAEYEEKIKQAKERAQVQFQEDFVSKLQSNIYTVEGQIKDLNLALRGISFGKDQYRFHVSPNPQYLRFYQMIRDELLMEGFGLFSQSFQEKHGDVVEELFRNIVDVDETDALAMTELEKNLEKFTDYRTYLNFDLIVKDEEGRESRLSRVIAKKSGGETQTPFYISVLASFVQLYRVGRPGTDNTLRLIVFDEAYSKMDHQRIRESVRLIRDLGLQVILSAPTEKLADIAPIVDKTLIVTRISSQTKVLEFDMSKEVVKG